VDLLLVLKDGMAVTYGERDKVLAQLTGKTAMNVQNPGLPSAAG
jgi:ABC-type protease/lipase transport system fused ATPase/permease subunit